MGISWLYIIFPFSRALTSGLNSGPPTQEFQHFPYEYVSGELGPKCSMGRTVSLPTFGSDLWQLFFWIFHTWSIWGWGPLSNQPHIHLISPRYVVGSQSPFKGLQQKGLVQQLPATKGISPAFWQPTFCPATIRNKDLLVSRRQLTQWVDHLFGGEFRAKKSS